MGIDITSPIGFGALIAHTLLLHAHFERSGIEGYVRARSPLYSNGDEDVLARFFERESWPADLSPMPGSAAEYLGWFKRPDQIDLVQARALYARHFRPNARLLGAVTAAAGAIQRYDLSVHYRGTDKFLESGQVDASRMFGLIESHLDGIAAPHIFLATDDAGFARTVRQRFPEAQFSSYDLGYVKAGAPRHFSSLGPDEKSLEALVNMHLLARAPVCVRTSSYLSAISALINPALRTITINQTQAGKNALPFPELGILQSEQAQTHAVPG